MDADIIVIGAGAAGLAAARSLAARSLRVVVVEARDRIGGRAWSLPIDRAQVPAELGAEFIHGRAPETMALLRESGAAAIDTGGDSWIFENGEMRLSSDDDFAGAADLLHEAAALSIDQSVDAYLGRYESDGALHERVRAARSFIEGFDAADPAIASARSIGEEWQSGVDSISARPLRGYRSMFEYLGGACTRTGVQIRLSTRLRHIAWQPGKVRIEAQGADQTPHSIEAPAAIVTLPAGVLRHAGGESEVVFDPPLPDWKQAALEKIETGHVVRIVLSFRNAFWEQVHAERYRDAGFFRCLQQPFSVYWTQMPVRSEQVVAWAGGPKAAALTGQARDVLIDRALDGFGLLFGDVARARREFQSAVLHDWNADPYSRGAYSYVAVNGGDARDSLARPIGDVLFFAGEATAGDGQGGTVNGALETGERAADETAKSLGVTVA